MKQFVSLQFTSRQIIDTVLPIIRERMNNTTRSFRAEKYCGACITIIHFSALENARNATG